MKDSFRNYPVLNPNKMYRRKLRSRGLTIHHDFPELPPRYHSSAFLSTKPQPLILLPKVGRKDQIPHEMELRIPRALLRTAPIRLAVPEVNLFQDSCQTR